ncbi:centrosomal protein CCDC61 [Monodelphis domestica]|uniref:centrosomal protein CCDC61 n=1 Tax=Monodelphis domestica TaxID=13616 RepID=UPI0024E1BB23|nr:centrosomal protein CCDC61 [Monodelphis domestica]XP_056652267.1 centrosomal protein CCDC61 [Monodelphis domestica]XP_056652268.1 centrosomal protein CCDC61 [Monodelphis domestica]XP_056652269.1 centrosomal protein CCDC61 [Monodelphis domestica]XP_056652270.1 centrosomal protein CCDC61 [Monodelphis domestica]XP_056652271.1 centrosomal protein CCDC61 [Monodelphis domestica]
MDQPSGLQVDYTFRGVEHVVRLAVSGEVLELEVEDRLTTDQWRGEFDSAFIEDLTHKTGNFKQFSIFCSMLESALMQSSESVTLDLLTYTDLEALRHRKVGPRPGPSAPRSAQLNSKRYLILIYSVEFDRIHYPLPLPYQGKPDPVVLQGIIRSLKEELAELRSRGGRDAEIRHLREQLTRAVSEKRELEVALDRAREEAGGRATTHQEVAVLKTMVANLEEELRRERGQHHRTAGRRGQECRRLTQELEEVKSSERSLRARLKCLSSELALYKRGRRTPSSGQVSQPRKEQRRTMSQERSLSWGRVPPRSSSQESSRGRRPSRPSPSPPGIRAPRFDPTAFVKAKERKQRELKLKNQQRNRLGTGEGSGSWGRSRTRGSCQMSREERAPRSRTRSSSVESFRSRHSSLSSASEFEDFSNATSRGLRRQPRGRKPLSPSSWNGSAEMPTLDSGHRRRQASSTPTPRGQAFGKENTFEEPSADLSEIDARLQALQEYMNRLDTRT